MTRNNQLRDVLVKASALCDLRRGFFFQWLNNHFGFDDEERIEAYLAAQGNEKAKYSMGLVQSEYEWCRDTAIERICQLKS